MLFRAKDMKFAKALEYIAGGKLFNIIVENEIITQQLLEKGCFTQRETCIPNNKIVFYDIPQQVMMTSLFYFLGDSEYRRKVSGKGNLCAECTSL